MAVSRTSLSEDEKDNFSIFADEEKDILRTATKLLPRPADRGSHAWLFLCASFLVEGVVFGVPGAYGVFQEYYSMHEPFNTMSNLPAVATSAMGIMYLGMPITMGLQRMFPRATLWAPLFGVLIMSTSLIAASFSSTVPHLIATQGVLFAVGSSLSYCPCVAYLNEWFDKHRSIAFGVMWAGTGLSGSVLPFVLEYLLDEFGFRMALRICAAGICALLLPLIYFIKPRLPAQLSKGYGNPFNFSFVFSRTFLLHQLANIVQALGHFLPSIYLPTYATTILGAGKFPAAATILLLNVASTVGCPTMGWLAGRYHVTACLCLATLGGSLATFLLWGFTTNLPMLLFYCGVYGLFAGSYSTAWSGLMRQVTTDPTISTRYDCKKVDPVMVIAVLAAGRGVGSVLSGPLSQALASQMPWQGQLIGAYGSGYGPLIIFSGSAAALSGLVVPWRYFGWIR